MSAPRTTAQADARIAPTHPFAQHLRRHAAAEAAAPSRVGMPADGPLPSLYLSHGAATDPTAPVTTAVDGFALGLCRRSSQAA